jgi:hypothetical protein
MYDTFSGVPNGFGLYTQMQVTTSTCHHMKTKHNEHVLLILSQTLSSDCPINLLLLKPPPLTLPLQCGNQGAAWTLGPDPENDFSGAAWTLETEEGQNKLRRRRENIERRV